MKKTGKNSEGILAFRFGIRLVAKTEVNNLSAVLVSSESFLKNGHLFSVQWAPEEEARRKSSLHWVVVLLTRPDSFLC